VERIVLLLILVLLLAGTTAPARAESEAQSPAPAAGDAEASSRIALEVCRKGPGELPERLEGVWKVSLCISDGHTWIRFENVKTSRVHTLGRYFIGNGGWWDKKARRWIYPPAARSGVYLDRELRCEADVHSGKIPMLSVLVRNPRIYRGRGNGFGHWGVQNNCVTFARDAWHYYCGEAYPLPRIHAPDDLLYEVLRRHPEIRTAKRTAPYR